MSFGRPVQSLNSARSTAVFLFVVALILLTSDSASAGPCDGLAFASISKPNFDLIQPSSSADKRPLAEKLGISSFVVERIRREVTEILKPLKSVEFDEGEFDIFELVALAQVHQQDKGNHSSLSLSAQQMTHLDLELKPYFDSVNGLIQQLKETSAYSHLSRIQDPAGYAKRLFEIAISMVEFDRSLNDETVKAQIANIFLATLLTMSPEKSSVTQAPVPFPVEQALNRVPPKDRVSLKKVINSSPALHIAMTLFHIDALVENPVTGGRLKRNSTFGPFEIPFIAAQEWLALEGKQPDPLDYLKSRVDHFYSVSSIQPSEPSLDEWVERVFLRARGKFGSASHQQEIEHWDQVFRNVFYLKQRAFESIKMRLGNESEFGAFYVSKLEQLAKLSPRYEVYLAKVLMNLENEIALQLAKVEKYSDKRKVEERLQAISELLNHLGQNQAQLDSSSNRGQETSKLLGNPAITTQPSPVQPVITFVPHRKTKQLQMPRMRTERGATPDTESEIRRHDPVTSGRSHSGDVALKPDVETDFTALLNAESLIARVPYLVRIGQSAGHLGPVSTVVFSKRIIDHFKDNKNGELNLKKVWQAFEIGLKTSNLDRLMKVREREQGDLWRIKPNLSPFRILVAKKIRPDGTIEWHFLEVIPKRDFERLLTPFLSYHGDWAEWK